MERPLTELLVSESITGSSVVTEGVYLQQLGAVVQLSLAAIKSFPVVTHDCGQSLPHIREKR